MLFSHRFILGVSVAIVMALTAARAHCGTIVNGGFETDGLNGWNYGGSGVSYSCGVVEDAAAPEGSHYTHMAVASDAFFPGDYEAHLWFGPAAPFSASAGDVLTFDYRASTWTTDPLAGEGTVTAAVEGAALAWIPLQLNGTNWATASLTLPATGDYNFLIHVDAWSLIYNDGNQTIIGASSAAMDIDNVRVTPEPSTLLLAAVGLIGLLAYAWRKRR